MFGLIPNHLQHPAVAAAIAPMDLGFRNLFIHSIRSIPGIFQARSSNSDNSRMAHFDRSIRSICPIASLRDPSLSRLQQLVRFRARSERK